MFLSTAIVLIFVSYLSYLADTYLLYAASAIAANTVCRSAVGAVAPLFTAQMFDTLGVAGAGSLIGGIAVLLAPIPFLFWRYGNRIRQRSKFAPTDTLATKRASGSQGKLDSKQLASHDEHDRVSLEPKTEDLEKQMPQHDHTGQRLDPYLDDRGLEKTE